jgi:formate hydrogenlyase subunit 4
MKPLSDQVVIVALIAAVGICFALAFWTVRLHPSVQPPLQWRQGPSAQAPTFLS